MTNPNDPKNNGKNAHRIERPNAGENAGQNAGHTAGQNAGHTAGQNAGHTAGQHDAGRNVRREEPIAPREGHQEHVAPRDGERTTDPVRNETRREQPRREVRREEPRREVRTEQPRREAEPVKEEGGSNPLKWILPIVGILLLLGLLWWALAGNDDDKNEAPATTEAATSEAATTEASGTEQPTNAQEDEAANAEADAFVKEQLGVQSYDELADDPSNWGGHVNKVSTDGNNLVVDLDVDKGSEESQALGKNAATEVADFVRGHKDDERVGDTNFVKVNDNAGELIQQENV